MKKYVPVIAAVLLLSVFVFDFFGYQRANSFMKKEEYQRAYEIFQSVSWYRNAEEKAEECSLRLGYETADTMKTEIAEAITVRDEGLLLDLIRTYITMEHSHNEVSSYMNDYVIETICAHLEAVDYDYYLFLDRVIAASKNDDMVMAAVGDRLMELESTHKEHRAIAFMTGTWKRIDSTDASGLRIRVTFTEENNYAMILEDFDHSSAKLERAKFHWEEGLLNWNHIQIVDTNYVTMDTMWIMSYYNLGVQSNRYEDCVGFLDYDGMRIFTQSTGEESITWQDNFDSDIYVKETAIKEVSALSEADFNVSFNDTNNVFEATEASLNEWFSKSNTIFYVYNDVNALVTDRGISVGSTWKDVVEKYGYGRGNLYLGDDDAIHTRLKKAKLKAESSGALLCDILSNQADEYMEYSLEDTNQRLRFYFDEGIVTWICFYTK